MNRWKPLKVMKLISKKHLPRMVKKTKNKAIFQRKKRESKVGVEKEESSKSRTKDRERNNRIKINKAISNRYLLKWFLTLIFLMQNISSNRWKLIPIKKLLSK